MQLCGTIYCPLITLHVLSDISHHQELLNFIFLQLLVIHTYVMYVKYVCITRSCKKYSLEAPDDER